MDSAYITITDTAINNSGSVIDYSEGCIYLSLVDNIGLYKG